ncbi:sugar phosphate isomerase/epimerase [Membranicola marinus]|uniref:Sugar phosphate isomerase/epimerase n=1 Tax=Membranihabitans marinus TaxID=1227546 RepID=A0A953HWS3_9BACT|nr:TIM barrel protein [Membranihabitans marinus]MBY5959665.1 sugar phosphate isomerase/epimerase [Membranihabitans marinus]
MMQSKYQQSCQGIRRWFLLSLLILIMACGSNDKQASNEASADAISGDIPVGVALYSFNRFAFPETLEKSKQAGTTMVEGFFFHKLGEDFDHKTMLELSDADLLRMKNFIEEKGLEMPSVYAGAETRSEWERFFKIGEILDLEFVVAEPEPEHWDLLDSLGQASGIKMAIHEHARGKSRYWHPDSVLVAVDNRPSFGACGDLGHWVRSGLDPVECLKKLEGHLISIHAKDLDEFGKIDANDVKVGSGVIDYPAVMEELHRQNFKGPVFVECEHDWEDNLDDVKYAVDYLNELQQ